MSKTTYKVKGKYSNTSICPNVKVVVLSELSQEQIKLVISQGHDEYFEEVTTKKSKK